MRRLGRLLLRGLGLALALAGIGLLAAFVFVGASLERLSRSDLLGDLRLAEPLRIYSADGLLMAEFGAERRIPVPFEAIPKRLVDAFLAAEDSRFYEHGGHRPARARAGGAALPADRRAGGRGQHHHHAGGAQPLPDARRRPSSASSPSC